MRCTAISGLDTLLPEGCRPFHLSRECAAGNEMGGRPGRLRPRDARCPSVMSGKSRPGLGNHRFEPVQVGVFPVGPVGGRTRRSTVRPPPPDSRRSTPLGARVGQAPGFASSRSCSAVRSPQADGAEQDGGQTTCSCDGVHALSSRVRVDSSVYHRVGADPGDGTLRRPDRGPIFAGRWASGD